jgi:hypothetical protein
MSLAWREFERRVRTLHRTELAASPALNAEFKRQRKSENSSLNRVLRRLLMPLFWCVIFLNVALKTRDVSVTAAVITLWAAATALRWAHFWFHQFYGSEDLVVLNHLPLSDRQIFRFQAERYAGAAGWTVWEFLLAYTVLGIVQGTGGTEIAYLGAAALLQSALIVALALHAASRLHMLPLSAMAGLLYAAAATLLILGARGSESTRYIVQASQWFLPTGWINYVLLQWRNDLAMLALIIPIGAIIYLARFSWERLRAFYSLEGFEILPSPSRSPIAGDDDELTGESFRRAGPTEIEDHVLARSFLLGVNWETAGWLERFASRFLNDEERVITEFLVAHDPGWSRGFRRSFWVWAVACAVVLLLGHLGGAVVFFAAYILMSVSLPLYGGDWRGMRQGVAAGVFLPAFALYPITFNAITWIFVKVNFLRILAALPFMLSFGWIAAWKLGHDPLAGISIAAKLIAILLMLQPLMVLLPISNSTNDTSRIRLIWFGVFLPVLFVVLGSAVGVFVSGSFLGMLLCYLMLNLCSLLFFAVYRRAYRKSRFDLFTRPRANLG